MADEKPVRSTTAGAGSQTEAAGGETAARVLIVDDVAANAELLRAYMADSPWTVATAGSGREALDMIAANEPDIILLDIMMPEMSGYEVCRVVKTDPRLRDIPVIMVTALTEVEDVEKALDAGTDDFLSKPVNRLELVTRVRSLLRLRHLRSELSRAFNYLDDLERKG